jgi:hypothetical protein
MGYHYIGSTSFYKLTIPEIRRLQTGYAALNRTEGTKGIGPRESDYAKLEKFKNSRGLR